MIPNEAGEVDGEGIVSSIYGAAPRDRFPEPITQCIAGLHLVDNGRDDTLIFADECLGVVVELERESD